MNLSAELFQAVVEALRVQAADERPNPGFSTLCARRVRLGGRALVIPCKGEAAGEPVEAVARDVSPSGIALTVPLRMVHGDRFILHLPGICGCLVGMFNPSILCTVARYQHTADGLYTLGATFTRILCRPKAAGIGQAAVPRGIAPLASRKGKRVRWPMAPTTQNMARHIAGTARAVRLTPWPGID